MWMPTKPYTSGILVTNKCNLRCRHCAFESGHKGEKELSDKEIFNLLDCFAEHQIFDVDISGGEPFLREGLIIFLNMGQKKVFSFP